MIRTLIFMGLIAMSMLTASCSVSHCVQPLDKTVRETLKYLKREVNSTIKLTTEKVQRNEMDLYIGNKIIDSLTTIIKQFDSLTAVSYKLGKRGYKQEILAFAERTNVVIQKAMTNTKTLCDLYDISTSSQFETTAVFPTDSIYIPAEKINKAINPIAQRIVQFFADHPRERFEAVIVCSCTLADQRQNMKLCELRARAVANQLIDQIKLNEQFIPKPHFINYYIQWVPKQEALPDRRRKKQHAIEDERRNTISLKWHLLPASIYK